VLERKTVKYKFKLTAVALANKVARIVFALMTRGGHMTTVRSRPDDREGLGKGPNLANGIEGVDELM